jgi:hypothetical protein
MRAERLRLQGVLTAHALPAAKVIALAEAGAARMIVVLSMIISNQ